MPVIKIKVQDASDPLKSNMQRIMDSVLHVAMPVVMSGRGWVPSVDVCETRDAFLIVADISGVKPEDFRLTLDGQFLRLAGHRCPPLGEGQKVFYQVEIEYGPFERVIRLPAPDIDQERVDALYENGLLVVNLPRRPTEERIRIHVS